MFTIETLIEFLGWSTVINMGMLLLVTFSLILFRDPIMKIHGKMFGLDNPSLSRAYFQYIAQYKIAIVVLNLVPYLSLKIIA
jgi:hypothetical protein